MFKQEGKEFFAFDSVKWSSGGHSGNVSEAGREWDMMGFQKGMCTQPHGIQWEF